MSYMYLSKLMARNMQSLATHSMPYYGEQWLFGSRIYSVFQDGHRLTEIDFFGGLNPLKY